MGQAPEMPPFPIEETGDGAAPSLSPPRQGGETRLHGEALQACGGAVIASG